MLSLLTWNAKDSNCMTSMCPSVSVIHVQPSTYRMLYEKKRMSTCVVYTEHLSSNQQLQNRTTLPLHIWSGTDNVQLTHSIRNNIVNPYVLFVLETKSEQP